MAHDSNLLDERFLFGLNNYIAKEVSSKYDYDDRARSSSQSPKLTRPVWKLNYPPRSRKNHLSVQSKIMSVVGPKTRAIPLVSELPLARDQLGSALKLSTIELPPPQTQQSANEIRVDNTSTVYEINMDSPTIPGRPALPHVRSASVSGYQPSLDGSFYTPSMIISQQPSPRSSVGDTIPNCSDAQFLPTERSSKKTVESPRKLRDIEFRNQIPLVHPASDGKTSVAERCEEFSFKRSNSNLSSEYSPPDVPPKSRHNRRSSASSPQCSCSHSPLIASKTESSSTREHSQIRDACATTWNSTSTNSSQPSSAAVEVNHSSPWKLRGQSVSGEPREWQDGYPTVKSVKRALHRRVGSDASVMDRGRPRKPKTGRAEPTKKDLVSTEKKRMMRQEIFESLPKGCKATEVHGCMSVVDINVLRNQALGQAAKFEVLEVKDVESLSRELRSLDERCDYLRKTHKSLRSDRQGLQSRTCLYLRSSRDAVFSHDALLKQEEALAELDLSIDDWDNKLQLAENRRMRVRQKLLEHVAAAITIQGSDMDEKAMAHPRYHGSRCDPAMMTPPRSPAKSNPAEKALPTVPRSPPQDSYRAESSTTAARMRSQTTRPGQHEPPNHLGFESIQIYMENDVEPLFADIEKQMERMGSVKARVNKLETLASSAYVPPRCSIVVEESLYIP